MNASVFAASTIIAAAFFQISFAQWVRTDGPYGGQISSVIAHGNALFAGSKTGGVYRSVDGGTTWAAVNKGLKEFQIYSLAACGNALFAGTESGIYRFTGEATSWTRKKSFRRANRINTLAGKGSVIFAGTWESGVLRSTDNGEKWTAINSGLQENHVVQLSVRGNDVFALTLNFGFYKSGDNGDHWKNIWGEKSIDSTANFPTDPNSEGPPKVHSLFVDGNSLYATTSSETFRSTDNGRTWSAVMKKIRWRMASFFTAAGDRLFASSQRDGFSVSTDWGASWEKADTKIPKSPCNFIAAINGKIFMTNTREGLLLSVDTLKTCSAVNSGFADALVSSFAASESGIVASAQEGTIFMSCDNGMHWKRIGPAQGRAPGTILSCVLRGDEIFALTDRGGIVRSAAGGTGDWRTMNPPKGMDAPLFLRGNRHTVFCAFSGKEIHRFSKTDTAWTRIGGTIEYAADCAVKDSVVVVGTATGEFFRSTDNGSSFKQLGKKHAFTSPVRRIAAQGAFLAAATDWEGHPEAYRSSDSGITWTRVAPGLPDGYVDALYFLDSALVAVTDGGVFYSTLQDTGWTKANQGFECPTVGASLLIGETLFVASGCGSVWRRSLREMTATRSR